MTVELTYHGHSCFPNGSYGGNLCGFLLYNTFGIIEQDAQAVAEAVRQQTAACPVILRPGETMNVA